jgi:hypothetical protein
MMSYFLLAGFVLSQENGNTTTSIDVKPSDDQSRYLLLIRATWTYASPDYPISSCPTSGSYLVASSSVRSWLYDFYLPYSSVSFVTTQVYAKQTSTGVNASSTISYIVDGAAAVSKIYNIHCYSDTMILENRVSQVKPVTVSLKCESPNNCSFDKNTTMKSYLYPESGIGTCSNCPDTGKLNFAGRLYCLSNCNTFRIYYYQSEIIIDPLSSPTVDLYSIKAYHDPVPVYTTLPQSSGTTAPATTTRPQSSSTIGTLSAAVPPQSSTAMR